MKSIKLILLGMLLVVLGCTPCLETKDEPAEVEDSSDVSETVTETTETDDTCEQEDTSEDSTEEDSYSWETWTDCSQVPGDHHCNFTLTDQNGEDWTLYDNYQTVMVIDFSTMWCSVCRNIAPDVQAHMDSYTSRGYDFVWVTVLIENATGDAPELSEIQDWANTYGMTTSPVLMGSRDLIDLTAQSGYPITSWPTLVVINKDMVLYQGINGWNEATVFGWVDEALGITP